MTDAIAAGDKRCATCHPGGGAHAASHEGGLSRPDCLECHKSNIAEEHENNCDKCHKSTDPAVVAAICCRRGDVWLVPLPRAIHAAGFFSIKTDYYEWTTTPGPRDTGTPLGESAPTPRTRARTPTTWPPPPSAASATPSTVRQATASSCCRPPTPRAPVATPAARPSRPSHHVDAV